MSNKSKNIKYTSKTAMQKTKENTKKKKLLK